jgi:hypothetical protein
LTVFSLRPRAGSVSHRRRSWDSPFGAFSSREGIRCVSAPEAPTYRFSCRYTQCRSTEPARQAAVPGVRPFRESLATTHVFSTRGAGCSLGFNPSRVLRTKALVEISPDLLSRACPAAKPTDGASEYRSALVFASSCHADEPRVWMRPPFEGFRTSRVLNIRTSRRPGYVLTSRSTAHYCARHRALWTEQALPELSGTA